MLRTAKKNIKWRSKATKLNPYGNMKNCTKLLAIQPFHLSPTRFFNSIPQTTHQQSIQYTIVQTPATLSSALQHYINSTAPSHGRKIHAHILKTGFKPNTNVSIKILILYLKTGCLKYARQVFEEMPQPTLSAYNYMVGGYLRERLVEKAIDLVQKLLVDGYERPDGFTLSMILKASSVVSNGGGCGCGNVVLPRRLWSIVHGQIIRLDIVPDDVLYTAVVDSYVKAGNVGYARRIFDLMMDRNVICSTSMITGYMNYGSVAEAEEIFERTETKDIVVYNAMIEGYSKSEGTATKALEFYIDMQRVGFRPNVSTFASVIGACSLLTDVGIGVMIQSQVMKICFSNVKISSALVDMYAKCGEIDDARRVFDEMALKNVFSWSSMIDGYGKSGETEKALELFGRMEVEPNHVTFLAVISACGHGGLVAKGREIFDSMERDYSLKPKMEHYACIVDLLGRAGCLQEAWEVVMAMEERPNSDVWAALLNSCNFYGNVEMANVAANELFKLNAKGRPGAYVSFSNTLAAVGKWDDVGRVRDVMKVRGVLKDTASSWVGTESSP